MKRVASAAVLALVVSTALWMVWSGRDPSDSAVLVHPTDASPSLEMPGTQTLLEGLEDEVVSSGRSTIPIPPANGRKAVLAGVVVDDLGAPLQAAEVLMIALGPKGNGNVEREKPRTTHTDATGRFRFEVPDATRMYRLHASSEGHLGSEGLNVQANRDDLKLVLTRARFVSGHIVLDGCVPTDQIRVRLDRPSREGRPVQWVEQAGDDDFVGRLLSADGKFSFEGVSASPVNLTVFAQGESITTIEGIDAGLGGSPSDPRLDPLDLRGKLTCFTIEVQDDTGSPCSGAVVALRSRDFAINYEVMAQGGRVKFVVPTGAYDVEIKREGCRRVQLSSVAEDRVVRLQRGIAVRAVVDPRPVLPPAPYRLLIAVIDGIDEREVDIDCIGALDNAGAAALLVSSPGRHRVAWYLENGNRRHFLYGIPSRTVEVLDHNETEEIRLDDRPEIRRSWEAKIQQVEAGK